MKKLLVLLTLLLVACAPQEENYIEIEQPLLTKLGLNLKTTVSDATTFNIGVERAGTYTIKIDNLNGELLSKSKLNLETGNNELLFYTKSLGSQPLSVILLDTDGSKLAETKIGTK